MKTAMHGIPYRIDTFSNEIEREKTGKSRSADELGGEICEKRGCEWGMGERRESSVGIRKGKADAFRDLVFAAVGIYSGHIKSLLNFSS